MITMPGNLTILELLEWVLVVGGLLTSILCAWRLAFEYGRTGWLARRFRKRVASIDPGAARSLYPFWGLPLGGSTRDDAIKRYVSEKGGDADPELVEL
jgi:hypothetical protein